MLIRMVRLLMINQHGIIVNEMIEDEIWHDAEWDKMIGRLY